MLQRSCMENLRCTITTWDAYNIINNGCNIFLNKLKGVIVRHDMEKLGLRYGNCLYYCLSILQLANGIYCLWPVHSSHRILDSFCIHACIHACVLYFLKKSKDASFANVSLLFLSLYYSFFIPLANCAILFFFFWEAISFPFSLLYFVSFWYIFLFLGKSTLIFKFHQILLLLICPFIKIKFKKSSTS